MTDSGSSTIRVLRKPGNKVCVLQLNTSKNVLNDYHRKTHFIFAMDVSASMDEPAIMPESNANISPNNTRLNYITRVLGGCLAFLHEACSSDSFNDILVSVLTFSTKAKTIVKHQKASLFTESNNKWLITEVKRQRRESTNFEEAMKHIASDISLIKSETESNFINEIVVFLTDGCITSGMSDRVGLAKLMCPIPQHVPDWRFIGVGVDFDYLLLNGLKQMVTNGQHQITNTPVITVDFLDNMDNASIIYADILSPYTSSSVYNSRFFSLDAEGYAPVYFGNPTTCELDSKQFNLGIVPSATVRYIIAKMTDELAFAIGYTDSKFHPCHGNATTELIVASQSFVNIVEGSEDSLLYDVMIIRQECMETVGTCYSIIESIASSEHSFDSRRISTPLRPMIRRSLAPHLQDDQNRDNTNNDDDSMSNRPMTPDAQITNYAQELKDHKIQMEAIQQKVRDFIEEINPQTAPIMFAQILNQCIDDITFALAAIDRVITSGDTILSRMVIGSRLNSQQYQRAYTITDTSVLENPSSPNYNTMNSHVSLTNNNSYTPYTPSVTRTISHVISTQSQLY